MWERFELFWTALEKFALFFSFIASLTCLVVLLLIYNAVADLEISRVPILQPQHVDPLIDMTRKGFEQIQGAVIETHATISYSVPITVEFLYDDKTSLTTVGDKEITTGEIMIKLRDDAGVIYGQEAKLEVRDKTKFEVRMKVSDSNVVNVPLSFEAPVVVSLSSLDLTEVIKGLQETDAQIQAVSDVAPQPAGGDAR